MPRKRYIAIIGDLVGSRFLPDREKAQKQLEETLKAINREFYRHISARFVITIGDEFQGLVSRKFPFRKFFDTYKKFFGDEYSTRFGIGLGELTTPLRADAVGMDGRCFHHARAALEQAKKQKKSALFIGFEYNTAINAIYQLIVDLESNWTNRQKEVLTLYQQLGDYTAVAKELQITKQSVFDSVNAAKYDLWLLAWEGIEQLTGRKSESFSP